MTLEHAERPITTAWIAQSMSRVRVVLVAALVTLTAALTVTATASAAFPEPGSAQNIGTLYLRFPTRPSYSASTVRTIDLAAGLYDWQISAHVSFQPWYNLAPSRLYLKAGTYTWRDSVVGFSDGRGYDQRTSLKGPTQPRPQDIPRFAFDHGQGLFYSQYGSTLKLMARR